MKRHILPILVIVIVSIAIYTNTLKNSFVYDDEITIVNNTFIRDIGNLSKLFQKNYLNLSGETSYRPIVTITYFLDYVLFDLNPKGYHLTNVILHTFNGILLYIFLYLLIKSFVNGTVIPTVPLLIGSLLFVTHPVLTEAVNGISFREDLLVFSSYISSLILYLTLRLENKKHLLQKINSNYLYFLSYFLYMLALFSKEMAVTLPMVILCWEWLRKKMLPQYIIVFKSYYLGYILITLIYLYIRFYLFRNPFAESFPEWWTIKVRLLTLPLLVQSYIKLNIFPISLSAHYVFFPVKSLFSLSFFVPLVSIIAIIALIRNRYHLNKGIVFGFLFFLITLIPVYNIIPIFNPFAERYLYLPIVGPIIMLTTVLQTKFTKGYLIHLLFILIIGIYSIGVINRNKVWKDNCLLWTDTVKKSPYSPRAFNGLGICYYEKGYFDDAIKSYYKALQLESNDAKTYYNLGLAYAKQNSLEKAIENFAKAIKLKSISPEVHMAMGHAYYAQVKFDEAAEEFRIATMQKPDYAEAYHDLGTTYYRQGNINEAIREYVKALRSNPNPDTYFNLGSAYASLGEVDKAIEQYEMALRLNPNDPEIITHLEQAYRIKTKLKK